MFIVNNVVCLRCETILNTMKTAQLKQTINWQSGDCWEKGTKVEVSPVKDNPNLTWIAKHEAPFFTMKMRTIDLPEISEEFNN